jgi:hypothetical protein
LADDPDASHAWSRKALLVVRGHLGE